MQLISWLPAHLMIFLHEGQNHLGILGHAVATDPGKGQHFQSHLKSSGICYLYKISTWELVIIAVRRLWNTLSYFLDSFYKPILRGWSMNLVSWGLLALFCPLVWSPPARWGPCSFTHSVLQLILRPTDFSQLSEPFQDTIIYGLQLHMCLLFYLLVKDLLHLTVVKTIGWSQT